MSEIALKLRKADIEQEIDGRRAHRWRPAPDSTSEWVTTSMRADPSVSHKYQFHHRVRRWWPLASDRVNLFWDETKETDRSDHVQPAGLASSNAEVGLRLNLRRRPEMESG
jgi:hypothetical protein